MKIRNYFKLLYLILFFAFSLIGIFTYFSFQRIMKINRVDRSIHDLYVQSLELRMIEGDYLTWDLFNSTYFQTGKSHNIDRFDSTYSQAMNLCNELANSSFSEKIRIKNRLLSVVEKLDYYHQAFHQLEKEKRLLGFKDWGIQGEMRRAIHQVEQEIAGLNQPKLQVHMLMLRRHEKDYLMRRDLVYRDKFTSEVQAFIRSVKLSGLTADQQRNNIANLELYEQTFLKLIQQDQYIGESQSQGLMAGLKTSITDSIAEISALKLSVSTTSKNSINRIILILIVFIVVCALGTVIVGALIFHRTTALMGGEPEEVALIANNISTGNLLMRFDEAKDYEGIMKSVVTMARKLTGIIANIYTSSDQVVGASQQFSYTSQIISKGAFMQSSSIDTVLGTIDKVSHTIEKTVSHATSTMEMSETVKQRIFEIREQADLSLHTNQSINQKIKVINDITAQTKILALNAAVEAARAGNHGAGFHIIAEEVKRLAENTNQAAREIGSLTQHSLHEAEEVSHLIGQIIEPVSQSADLARQISEAGHEQNQNMLLIGQTLHTLYDLSQENTAASEEMAAGSTELEQQTRSLLDLVGYFNIGELQTNDGRIINIMARKNKKKKKKKDKSDLAERA